MPPKATGAASANTSKKRKITDAGDGPSTTKKARTTAATKAKPAPAKAKATTTKKTAAATKKTGATAAATKKAAAAPKKVTALKKTAASPKPAATKKVPAKKTPEPKTNGVTKRKTKTEEAAEEEDEIEEKEEENKKEEAKSPAAKKPKVEKKPVEPKPRKKGPVINERPTDILNVFVFGENSSGELGLGAEGKVIDVKRPRLNPLLKDKKIVSVAAGGMHQVFLTDDGKILTCGVNDQGSLGRETSGAEKLRDMDDDESDAGSDNGLNPLESTPTEIDLKDVPEGTVFTSIAAGDSITLAVTDEGLVYGCGTFRSNDGILGFTKTVPVQRTLVQIQGLKHIKSLACGANHVLALDKKGNAWAWGSGQQNQLGRRIVERTRFNGLTPSEFGLPKGKVNGVFCGAYHSFATDVNGRVWTWGLNSYGETGISDEAGEDDAVVHVPTVVEQLSDRGIVHLAGGAHHSLAVTDKGECLVFGRVDGYQMGIKISDLPSDDVVRDEHDKVRILKEATALPNVGRVVYGACGTDQSFAINDEGRAYAWGFSVNYQTGLGVTDDVEEATLIDNTATREEKLNWVDAGGQYGVLTSVQKAE